MLITYVAIAAITIKRAINKRMPKIGTRKTVGVPLMNCAVHCMTAIPILMFLRLKRRQQTKRPATPQQTYPPYR